MANTILLHKAIEFAAIKHKDQKRKASETPYIVHPVEVMMFLTESGLSDDVIAAGVLHDTLEDTSATFEELCVNFGSNVAELVAALSEDKSKSWRERKQRTIDDMKTANRDVVMLCLADKLSNLQSMVYDYEKVGETLWDRFNADKDSISWYYREIINATKDHNCTMRERLILNYIDLFGNDDRLMIE